MEHLAGTGIRPRVRLALGTAPLRPVAERLAWAYHGTAWVLGHEAAATLPLEPLFGPGVRAGWGWQASTITRTLRGIEPVLAKDARVVILLEGDGPESLVASVLGGVTAGYRLAAARLPEAGRESGGVVELVPPGSGAVPGGPRTRANVVLPPLPGGAGDPYLVPANRLFAAPEHRVNAPFSPTEAATSVVEAAVEVLRLRGEPVSFSGLLGEILVGLDRTGHLRRLVRPPAPAVEAGPNAGPNAAPDAGPNAAPNAWRRGAAEWRPGWRRGGRRVRSGDRAGRGRRRPDHAGSGGPSRARRPRGADPGPGAGCPRRRRWPSPGPGGRGSLVAGRAQRSRGRGRAPGRPRGVGRLQPPVDRRPPVRGSVPGPRGRHLHGPGPSRRGPGPRLPRELPEPGLHAGSPGHERRCRDEDP